MRTRVAVDLIGGGRPDNVLAGVAAALAADPDLHVVLVGPPALAAPLAEHPRVGALPADDAITPAEDPEPAVRARRGASVRVAVGAVRRGDADAAVSAGPVAATSAAAAFTFGLLPGATRSALCVRVPADRGPVLLLDTSGSRLGGTDVMLQLGYCGAAFVRALDEVAEPRVGVLAPGSEVAQPDGDIRDVVDALVSSPLTVAGPVTARAVTVGGSADVVLTDGFTGGVLRAALTARGGAAHVGTVLGVDGPVVAAFDPIADAVAAAVATAATVVRVGLVDTVRAALSDLVARRRELAGLR